MNWSQKDLDDYYGRLKRDPGIVSSREGEPRGSEERNLTGEGRNAEPTGDNPSRVKAPCSRMNNTEREYAQYLELQKATGEILWWAFEAIKMRLADATYYTPDFAVLRVDHDAPAGGRGVELEFHEVKGFWREDARIKIKVAAEMFPSRFIAVQKIPKRFGGGWKTEEFNKR